MRKIGMVLALTSVFAIAPAFADDDMDSDAKPCMVIAKACMDAGYTRQSSDDKRFWKDCMKPVLLGKTVSGVTVDAATVKDCRVNKIGKMKNEIKEFQNAK